MANPISTAKSGSAYGTLSTNIKNLDQAVQNITGIKKSDARPEAAVKSISRNSTGGGTAAPSEGFNRVF